MKRSVTFTPSQVVNLVLVLFSVVSPAVVKALTDAGYRFDPTLMATYGAAVAVIVGGCRAYLSSNSGTQSGVPTGPDRKAQSAVPAAPASAQAVYYGTAPAPTAPTPAAPVSGPPGAAQGVSGRGFTDVAAEDDDAEADNLVGGRESAP